MLSLDAVKYFITREVSHKDAAITNLYEMRFAETREVAENVMLQAEQTLSDMGHFWKDCTQAEFDNFIKTFDAELIASL